MSRCEIPSARIVFAALVLGGLIVTAAAWQYARGKDSLPRGPAQALIDAPMLRLGLEAFRRGDADGLAYARTLLQPMADGGTADMPCVSETLLAHAAGRDLELLEQLSVARGTSEMLRFALLRKALAIANRHKGSDRHCPAAQWGGLEQILPGIVPPPDAANAYYAEWRRALQTRMGSDYVTARDAAMRQVGADADEGDAL